MADPTLSVTVTNFNYGRYLDQNLRSILEQSFDDFELILIDNASTDDSLEIMRSYAACDRRIRVIAHPENLGMFASLEESCAVARGRYRVHVDADDWVLSPNAFKDQVDLLDQHPTMAFAYASLAMFDSGGTEILTSRPYPHDVVLTSETALEQLLTFSLSHSGMMLRLDYYRETKGYPDAYPHVSDQLLAVRLCERGDLVGYLDRPLYAFRQHGHNLHLRPQLQVVKHEILPSIDEAFDGPVGRRMPDADAAKSRVVRRALVHLPTQYVFTGRRRIGWRLYWESLKLKPVATLFQRRTLSLIGCTLLGRDRFIRLMARLHLGDDQ